MQLSRLQISLERRDYFTSYNYCWTSPEISKYINILATQYFCSDVTNDSIFAKFVSERKEVINTVLYAIYSMQFNAFPKNPGTTCAEIYKKQQARSPRMMHPSLAAEPPLTGGGGLQTALSISQSLCFLTYNSSSTVLKGLSGQIRVVLLCRPRLGLSSLQVFDS